MLKKTIAIFLLLMGSLTQAAVEKQQAIELVKRISKIMEPLAAEKNLQIKVDFKSMNTPGAFSKWEKRKKVGLITFSDELFYVDNVDLHAVAMIACHEYGHFLGGAPYVQPKPNGTIFNSRNKYEQMSVEGQADFFASSICSPLIEKLLENNNQDPIHHSFCKDKRSDCLTTLMGIKSSADSYVEILAGYDYHDNYTDLFDVTTFQTDRTLNIPGEYPTMQCRVLTMVQGLSCFENTPSGKCLNESGDEVELRPACWLKTNR